MELAGLEPATSRIDRHIQWVGEPAALFYGSGALPTFRFVALGQSIGGVDLDDHVVVGRGGRAAAEDDVT
jgi:hypothetical protein